MAGIGFELNKILSRPGYSSLARAYGYAALIGSGPWLVAVVSLALLGLVLTHLGLDEQVRIFFVSISLIYALTLVLTGPIQMVLTRHAADQQFIEHPENIFPTFVFTLAWTSLIFAVLGLVLFVGFVPGPLIFRLAAALLMVVVAGIWIASIFLTAIKNYRKVLLGFLIGCTASLVLTWVLAAKFQIAGAMVGFTIGHAVLLLVLCSAIYQEVGTLTVGDASFLWCFGKYYDLALAGLFYNLGIWVDKFLFWWFDPAAEHIGGILYASPIYDRVVYFSFLTIVPGMAVFLLKLETQFADKNAEFFQHVLKKGTYAQIHQVKGEMIAALRDGLGLLLKVQGLFTLMLILGAEQVLKRLGLGAVQAGIFQISLLGTFLLVIFMALLMVLHYLDKRRDAMICCLVFTAVNAALTAWTILEGDRWFGFGFLVAAGVGMVMAAFFVNFHLRHLEHDTFTSQGIYDAVD